MASVVYDYSRLLGRIKEKGYTQETLASVMHVNPSTLNRKLKNKCEFTQSEIRHLCQLLEVEDVAGYFFAV